MDYTQIFNTYTTKQGIPFTFFSRSVTFPSDNSLQIYDYVNIDDNYAYTVASYKIYGKIDYWWVLSALNPTMKLYVKRGSILKIIKPQRIEQVLRYI